MTTQQVDELIIGFVKPERESLRPTTEAIQARRAEAKAAYDHDRGWSVIHDAFPGTSPAE